MSARHEFAITGQAATAASTVVRRAPSVPRRALIRTGQFFFRYRDYLFPLLFVPVALGTRPSVFLDDPRADAWLDVAGLLLVAAGLALRTLVVGLSHIRRGGRDKKVHAAALLQRGLFAHSRNPLYVGNLTIVTGLVLVHNGRWMYIAVLPFFVLVYVSIVAAEESFLQKEFGDEYAEYVRRVPRFLPDLHGIGTTLSASAFDWKRVVRLEHATVFASCSAAILILAWEGICATGYAAGRARLCALALVWLAMLAAYTCIRIVKKRGAFSDS